MKFNPQHQNLAGLSILEIIIATAIFSLMATSLATLSIIGFRGLHQGGEQSQAMALAQEAIEAVRNLRDNGWNNLSYSQTGVSHDGTSWTFNTEGTVDSIGKFTRTISFEDVCRDGTTDDLVSCPSGYVDIYSKLLTINVSWETLIGFQNLVEKTAYITNWEYNYWTQTNWAGGAGQSIWSDDTKFDSADKIDSNIAGQLQLSKTADSSDGVWVLAGGAEAYYTSNIDFGTGTLDAIEIAGSGDTASLVLAKSNQWAEHDDTQVVNQITYDVDTFSLTNAWGVGNTGKIIHYDGTGWTENDDIGGTALSSIEIVASDDIWAVGASGVIEHYDGTSWSKHSDSGSNAWDSLDMLTATDGWAVGDRGLIYHYNGNTWSESTDTGNDNWGGVAAVAANDVWVVGDQGEILHYDGTSWSVDTDTGNETWNDISMVSAYDGWAVGDGGAIVQYDGTGWTEVSSPTSNNLKGVNMVAGNDGWAVGASGEFIHYGGSSWVSEYSPTSADVEGVHMLSSSKGWAVGAAGRIFIYDNFYEVSGTFTSEIIDSGDTATTWDFTSWIETLPSGSDITVATRTGNTSAPDGSWSVWSSELTNAMGASITSPDGRYLQYRITFTRGDSTAQTPELDEITIIYNSPSDNNLNGLDIVSSSDIWAVGASGTLMQYDGDEWILEGSPPTANNLNSVDMVASSDGWAVGDSGTIIRYDGTWGTVSSPGSDNYHDLEMLSTSEGWAVGDSGKIINYDGNSWSEHSDIGTISLFAIDMWSSTLGWAVGENGLIYKYNGSTWSQEDDAGNRDIYGIVMISSTDGWATAVNGEIYRYNGSTWPTEEDAGNDTLYTVNLASARAFAMGSGGHIHRYEGGSWSEDPTPSSNTLNDLEMINDANGWAVGDSGTIIKLTGDISYETSGNLISSAYDMLDSSPVEIINWNQAIPVCDPACQIKFQVRTAPDSSGTPGTWTNWYGLTGSGTYFTDQDGSIIPSEINGNQWVQYQTLLTGDGNDTPILQDSTIIYK